MSWRQGKDLCKNHNISEQTFYRWCSKFSGVVVADVRRLKDLESENAWLKRQIVEARQLQRLRRVDRAGREYHLARLVAMLGDRHHAGRARAVERHAPQSMLGRMRDVREVVSKSGQPIAKIMAGVRRRY